MRIVINSALKEKQFAELNGFRIDVIRYSTLYSKTIRILVAIMKLKLLSVIAFSLVSALCSCREFIEPSISKKQVELKAPAPGLQTNDYNMKFWWDPVDDALTYHLQIVSGSFDSIRYLVADTVIKQTMFSTTLDPGNYSWRVRAENGSSQTAYTVSRNLTIVPSSLTNQTVTLLSPASNSTTNEKNTVLKWNALYSATAYQIQIDTNNFENESSLVSDQTLPGQQFNFRFVGDQVYAWRVRAKNETEQSKWSSIAYITYDITPPVAVDLMSPISGATTSVPVVLTWTKPASAVKYRLSVYKSDSTTIYNNTFPLSLNSETYNFKYGNTGEKIYWKVTATDAAGNESKDSPLRNFVIQ